MTYIFNFSRSYSGGGLKRLLAFSKYFNENGGSNFIVNSKVKPHMEDFNHINFISNRDIMMFW